MAIGEQGDERDVLQLQRESSTDGDLASALVGLTAEGALDTRRALPHAGSWCPNEAKSHLDSQIHKK